MDAFSSTIVQLAPYHYEFGGENKTGFVLLRFFSAFNFKVTEQVRFTVLSFQLFAFPSLYSTFFSLRNLEMKMTLSFNRN